MYQSERGLHLVMDITHEDTGLPVDLTAAAVLFRMSHRHGNTIVLEKTCEKVGPGVVEVVFAAGDLDLPAGHYRREWRLIDGPTEQTIFEDEVALKRSLFYEL